MRSGCVQSIIQYAEARGKTLNQSDLRKVEERLTKHFYQMGDDIRAGDQRLAQMSPSQRLMEGAERAAKEILQEKQKKAINVAKQILATTRAEKFIARVAPQVGGRSNALQRMIVGFAGSQNKGFKDLDTRKTELKNFYTAKMVPFFKATEKVAGFWTDKKMTEDFVREAKGVDTGNPHAKAAAKEWAIVNESMRQQSNDAGSNIKKRGDWGLPQTHDSLKIAAAGFDQWVKDTFPTLDRTQFNDPNGKPMTDAEVHDFLKEAYKPLSTDGVSEITPGTYGASSIKSRGSQERQLHFTPEGWLQYQKLYGDETILGTLTSHINRMATHIASMETFGPNAEAAFKYLVEDSHQKDVMANPKKKSKADAARKTAQAYFDVATGKTGEMASPFWAHAFENFRAITAMAKLPYATVSALGDTVFLHLIAKSNNIPQAQAWLAELRTYNPLDANEKRVMERNGVGIESVLHNMNRFGQDSMGHGIPSLAANQLFRVNLLNKVDSARRRAVGAMMYKHVGDLVAAHADMSSMDKVGERNFLNHGISDQDFAIWKKAPIDDQGMLTPDSIMKLTDAQVGTNNPAKARLNAAQTLMGYAAKQAQYVVPLMTAKTSGDLRARIGPRIAGNITNELMHSLLQFKSFALSIMANNIAMLKDEPTIKGKAYYGAAFVAGTVAMGAISYQLKSLLHGKNPQNMDPNTPEGRNFWVRAVAQGGSLGLWGDLAAGPIAENKWEDLSHMLGPTYDTLNQLGTTIFKEGQALTGHGKQSDAGMAGVQLAKGLTPETIYTSEAFNHLVFQNLQNMLKPGYSQRVKERAQKEQGTSYYWPPGQAAPSGPPNLRTALGERQ